MKAESTLYLIIVLVGWASVSGFAQEPPCPPFCPPPTDGKTSPIQDSLALGMDAAMLGSGEAISVFTSSYALPFWHPSALAFAAGFNIGGLVSKPLAENGLSLVYAGATMSWPLLAMGFNAGIASVSQSGNSTSGRVIQEQLLLGTFAMRVFEAFSFGLSVQSHQSSDQDNGKTTFVSGLTWRVSPTLFVTATFADMANLAAIENPETGYFQKMMRDVRVNASGSFADGAISTGMQYNLANQSFRFGMEAFPLKIARIDLFGLRLPIRLGAAKSVENIKTAFLGFGVYLGFVQLDVAFVLQNKVNKATIVSVNTNF